VCGQYLILVLTLVPRSEITIWTFEGDVVHSLSEHTSFVYTLSILRNGDVASGGEDRSLRVWRGTLPLPNPLSSPDNSPLHRTDGECYQTIIHPGISVWSVSAMPNGDVVTGASDGIIRIFSEAEERWASPQELKAFDDLVAGQALPAQQIGDVKKSDLPGLEALSIPGTYSFCLTHTLSPHSSSRSQAGRGQNGTKWINNRGAPSMYHFGSSMYLTRLQLVG